MDKPNIQCVETLVTEEGLHYSRFVAEPLERGYGTTLGNALRRVLLSDLEGAAITAICIEGVQHEFSTISGMTEDIVDLILNLKGVVVKLHGDEAKTAFLSVKREGLVTAADITSDPDVEILNPEWHLATLDAGASLEMELQVERGKGFVPAERNRRPHQPVGVIPVDSIFMPVRKVNYQIEDTRVGQSVDFDRLILEIWSNGSIDPEEALARAAELLIEQFRPFALLARDEASLMSLGEAGAGVAAGSPAAELSIEELELSVRAYNCLKRANIYTVADLLKKTERELMDIKNFGKKSAEEVIERLRSFGYHMASERDSEFAAAE
jgi:DNA-directed RNA polymerase subunit alpha